LSELFRETAPSNDFQSANNLLQGTRDININLPHNQSGKIDEDAYQDDERSSMNSDISEAEKRKRISSCSNISRSANA